MKSSPEKIVVIHLGATQIHTVIACQSECKTKADIVAVGMADTKGSFYDGKIVHRERLVAAIKHSVRAAEEMANVRIYTAAICLASSEIQSNNCIGKVAMQGESIGNQHMAYALQVAKDKFLPSSYYLAQFVPQMIWLDDENYSVNSAIGMKGISHMQVSYHLMALPVQSLNNLYGVFKDCDVVVDNIIFDMVAAAQYALMDEERERGVLLVDIGAKSTSICVYKQNILVFSDCIAMGGDDVTMDIAAELSLSTSEAKRIKEQEASLQLTEEDKQVFVDIRVNGDIGVVHRYRLSQITKARYDVLFARISHSLEQADLSAAFMEAGIVLMGEGSQIKDIVSYLKKTWQVPVHKANLNTAIAYNPRKMDDGQIRQISASIKQRRLWTAFGAMLYCLNDEFHYQQRIHESNLEVDSRFVKKIKALTDGVVGFFKNYA